MPHPARLLLALAAVALWSCQGERDPRAGSSPWVLERVDMRGETGTGLALAVAGDGAILLSYYDRHHGDVMFAELRPWGWRRERVASAASKVVRSSARKAR